jgi:hypothetical protein
MVILDPILLTGILIVAMIPAYILILKKLKPRGIHVNKPYAKNMRRTNNDSRKTVPRIKKTITIAKEETLDAAEPEKSEKECAHQFGYLYALPKNTSIPNECLGCPKIVECLTASIVPKKA